jgi:hypothetical protein
MKRIKIAGLAAAIFMIAGLPLFTQGLSGGNSSSSFLLTITVNAENAVIYVDNVPLKGNVANVKPGAHAVKVTASGYYDFMETVNVRASMTVTANLRSRGYQVSINPNVQDAVIYVDGARIAGLIAMLLPGNHSIRITAPGFLDYVTTVNVRGPMVLNPQLKSAGHKVTINTNVRDPDIYVDGARISGNIVTLLPGNHSIRITADGYVDYVTTINVVAPIVLNAQLKSAGYQVTINTNVRNPDIYVDGARIGGNVAILLPGNHSLLITAEGYQDYSTTLKVSGPMLVNAQLAIAGFPLTVTSDVRGATVSINNIVKGTVPYTEYLPPATYMVVVSASGYTSYATSVALNSSMTVNAQLVSNIPATLSFIFPREFLEKDNRDPHGQIKILVDGKVAAVRGDAMALKIQPGRHDIGVVSGGLTVMTGNLDFAPGASYTIELFMELRMKNVNTR